MTRVSVETRERKKALMNRPRNKFFGIVGLAILVIIAVGCGTTGDDKDSEAPAASLQSPASPSEAGVNASDVPGFPNVVVHDGDIEAPRVVPTDLGLVWEAWEHLNRDYVDRDKLDPELAAEYAIRGITSILGDPQTAYVSPDVLQGQFGDVFEGEFQGIGAHVQMNARGAVVIVSPIEGGPADAAGIKPGDIILEVDGESLDGLSLLGAVAKIRGPKDSIARLLVKHLGALDPVIIDVIRAVIPLESVYVRSEPGDDFMHIRVTEFYPQTAEKLRVAIEEQLAAGAKGLILDLRNNGGGLLSASVDIASQFIEDGLVLYVIEGNKRRTDYGVKKDDRPFFTDIPMVVLVNGGSASASEILAGSLQDHNRATVIGDTTFGKGSVNWLRHLSNGGGLYITVAHWYTPDGRLIQGEGIEPDISVTDRNAQEADIAQFKRAVKELEKMTGITTTGSGSDKTS
jgi:carboxyl-terminal processing protease